MCMFMISLESVPWIDIFWGFFMIGVFLTIKSLIFALSADTDHDVDHDVGVDHDFDHDVDHDVGVDHGIFTGSMGDRIMVISRGAPLMLLIGSFFLVYGGLGIVLFSEPGNAFGKLIIMTFVVVFVLWVIDTLWSKLFTVETYLLPRKDVLVGLMAEVVLTVDKNGGVIRVDIGIPKILRFSAYPKNPNDVYPSGTKVRIVGWRKTFAIVQKA